MTPHLLEHLAPRRGADARAVTVLWAPNEAGQMRRPDGLPAHWVNIDCAGDCVARLSQVHQPHVIVCELSGAPRDFTNLRSVLSRYNAAIIFVAPDITPELALWALRERAWDVLPMPLSATDIQASVLRLLNASRRAAGQGARASGRLGQIETPVKIAQRPATLPAIQYIESNYKRRLSATRAAELCGMNSAYFSRVFKKEHGVGFGDFVLNHRLAIAKRYLAHAATTVTDAAFAAGFNDHSYFSKVFKRVTGVSPSDFQLALAARE